MDDILRIAIKTLGVTRVHEILAEFDKEPEPVVEKQEKKTKRIPRMSPTLSTALKKELERASIPCEEKKEFDKIKKEFVKYVESLTDNDFSKIGLVEHMTAFANLQTETSFPEIPSEIDTKDISEVSQDTINKHIERFVKLSEDHSIFYDKEDGKWVAPTEDEDEYSKEVILSGTKYLVGERTGRIYKHDTEEDVFAGFAGIGKFKEIKL